MPRRMKNELNELTQSWADPTWKDSPGVPKRMPCPGDVLAGRFELIRELGSGGSGIVFAAHDRVLGLKVAIKVIYPTLGSPATMERLRREVRVARSPHPNAAAVHDLHTADAYTFLAMELVEGTSLRDRLETGPPLPVDEAVAAGRQVAAALNHLHEQGLVHRDVKPGNLLVAPGGAVKLCDMGLVRALVSDLSLTETATAVGTPAYMAPEQATGEELTTAVDVYGLGLTLWQCLTGEVPLKRETAVATLMARQRTRPTPVRSLRRDCPRWLDRLLCWMLEPEPADRPTASQVEHALTLRRARPRFKVARRKLAAAAVAAILVALAAPVLLRAHHGAATRVEVNGSEVRGLDKEGHTAWRRDLGTELRQPVPVDLDGDGVKELALLPKRAPDVNATPVVRPARLTVLDREGRVRLVATPSQLIEMWSDEYNRSVQPTLYPMDLDGDGRTELVVTAHHPSFFPSALLLYWPAAQRWEQVLYHSGFLYDVVGVPGDPPRLRFLAHANRLGMLPVVAEIVVAPPSESNKGGTGDVLRSPETGLRDSARLHWQFYTPLVPERLREGHTAAYDLTVDDDGGSSYHFAAATGRVDALGNPVPGPNAGRDLRPLRRWFLTRLTELRWTGSAVSPLSPEQVREAGAKLAARAAPLLAEEPYRVLLGLGTSCALARAGDLHGAIAQLDRTAEETPYEEVVYRLAHLVALTGDLSGAEAELARPLSASTGAREGYDTPILRLRLAMEQRSSSAATREVGSLMAGAPLDLRDRLGAAMWARIHLWWDECTAADERAQSWAWAPGGEAIACLARWRTGATRPDDPERMARLANNLPDAAFEARLAQGAAQLALGHPGEALATLDAAAAALEPLARDDFLQHQLYDLARALRLTALAATGKRAEAVREAAELLPQLAPDVLPAILTREVLRGPSS